MEVIRMSIPIGENSILLCGVAATPAEPRHVSRGRQYYGFQLDVLRLSGAVDSLNVVLPGDRLPEGGIRTGDSLCVEGQVRTFNNKSGSGSRLVITVYAMELSAAAGEQVNMVLLRGVLCKKPVLRRTPMGREICDVMLAVNRHYGRADYLPVILWGSAAREAALLDTGDELHIRGRLQSRSYIKNEGDCQTRRTAFEISVIEVVREEAGA